MGCRLPINLINNNNNKFVESSKDKIIINIFYSIIPFKFALLSFMCSIWLMIWGFLFCPISYGNIYIYISKIQLNINKKTKVQKNTSIANKEHSIIIIIIISVEKQGTQCWKLDIGDHFFFVEKNIGDHLIIQRKSSGGHLIYIRNQI